MFLRVVWFGFIFCLLNQSILSVNPSEHLIKKPDTNLSALKKADRVIQIKSYIDFARYYDNRLPAKAVQYANQALDLSRLAGIPNYQAEALFYKGLAFYHKNEYDTAIHYFRESNELYKTLKDSKGMASVINRTGNAYQLKGNYKKALHFYKKALKINKYVEDRKEIARSLTNLGSIYKLFGNYEKAMDHHLSALEKYEKLNDKEGKAWSYLNIARLFKTTGEYKQALRYVNHSLEVYRSIAEETGIKTGITLCLKEKGVIYQNMGDLNKALELSLKTLEINKSTDNLFGVANSLANIGKIYYQMHQYDKGLDYFKRAYKQKKALNDKLGLPAVLRFMGKSYQQKGAYEKGVQFLHQSLRIAKEQNLKEEIRKNSQALSDIYEKLGAYKQSLNYYKTYSALKDSLNEQEITQLEMQYEFDKKQHKLEFEKKQKETELEKQKILTHAFIIGFVLMLLIAFLIYKNYKRKKETNRQLALQNEEIKQKNEEIQAQRDEIEEQRNTATAQRDKIAKQNELITDSINYASKIQNAVLPQESYIDEVLPEYFILFQPRDIVSGDFYWISQHEDKVVIAAADCTGHGVPGAFMSMMGVSLLNEIITNNNLTQPDLILNQLREYVIESLHQNERDNRPKDGMDIALCIMDKQKTRLQFSGAHNPLYIIRNNELMELPGDRMPIGIQLKKTDQSFTLHQMDLKPGDSLYMFSDGYTDQLGGKKREKFKKKKFKELLLSLQDHSMEAQKQVLKQKFDEWRGHNQQIDDILVMGVRV